MDDIGEYEEAIASYRKAIEINENDADVWNNLGISLHKLGEFREAISITTRASIILPKYKVLAATMI